MIPAQNIEYARSRDRTRNIYSATVAETPSYDDGELRAVIEGATVAGKPARETRDLTTALSEYDRAIDSLLRGVSPVFSGLEIAIQTTSDVVQRSIDIAMQVARIGAPVHSVVNALNTSFIAAGETPLWITRAATAEMLKAMASAREGIAGPLNTFLERMWSGRSNPNIGETERRRRVDETFASWALEGMHPDERDHADADAYVGGNVTPDELIARLKAEYGVS